MYKLKFFFFKVYPGNHVKVSNVMDQYSMCFRKKILFRHCAEKRDVQLDYFAEFHRDRISLGQECTVQWDIIGEWSPIKK